MLSCVQVQALGKAGQSTSFLRPGSSQHLSLLAHEVLQTMSKFCSWNDAELSLFSLERTILPRTSTPLVVMFPAALMIFSVTILQSMNTLALVLLIAM